MNKNKLFKIFKQFFYSTFCFGLVLGFQLVRLSSNEYVSSIKKNQKELVECESFYDLGQPCSFMS